MERSVTYPQVAVLYSVVSRAITQLIVPGPRETARFTVPYGEAFTYLPNNDPSLLIQFNAFLAG